MACVKNASADPIAETLGVSLQQLIDLQYVAKGLALSNKQLAASPRHGLHASRLRGRGIDFDEVRYYQAGDDIRHMNWRITARTGEPHTKIFHEERERPVFLLIDQSASLYFGTRNTLKSALAAQAAAILGWAAVQHGDRVGAIVFGQPDPVEIRPQGRHMGLLPLLKILSETALPQELAPQPGCLADALLRLRRVIRPGSLVFLLSDFLQFDQQVEQQLCLLSQHNDIMAWQLTDPLERQAPPPGRYPITDGRTWQVLDTYQKNNRKQFQHYYQQLQQHLQQKLACYRIRFASLSTDDNLLLTLKASLGR